MNDTNATPVSEGEYRIRTTFNPGNNSQVDAIKQKGAELINLINGIAPSRELNARDANSMGRLKSLAMTEIEHGIMDAVKAATV